VTGVAIFELYLDVSIRVRGMDFHIAQWTVSINDKLVGETKITSRDK
jgi:hypothetical protein